MPRPNARLSVVVATLLALAAYPRDARAADPAAIPAIPEVLRPWSAWVLHGHEQELCPPLAGEETRRCAWPGPLDLVVNGGGTRFTVRWTLQHAGWVPLPGDDDLWPQTLEVDGGAAAAVGRDGVPGVHLASGSHAVTGVLPWNAIPDSLAVPAEIGIVRLAVDGREVPRPTRDEGGRLWLRQAPKDAGEEERLEIDVARRVVDQVPLLVETRLDLAVAGAAREALLGPVLLTGAVPVEIASDLPARVEPDGRLRVQVRPGTWTVTVTARLAGPVAELAAPRVPAPWPGEEIWVFEAQPELRVVDLEGAAAVDPQQTKVPDEWKALPAYRLAPGEAIRLVERRRGDADPSPDRIDLARELWLDFDGRGFTVRDRLAGTLTRSWRLEMGPPTTLARVVADGRDQVITRRAGTRAAGVEVRQGALDLVGESRVEGALRRLPAVGWEHDVHALSAELHLPPGWRLLGALGVDAAPGSWVSRWNLLDLFLVLVVALATRALFGNLWGAIALVTLTLSLHETGAPAWLWIAVLAAEAVRRLVERQLARREADAEPAAGDAAEPARGRALLRFVRLAWAAAFVVLALVAVPFVVRQIRAALYPALEVVDGGDGSLAMARQASYAPAAKAAPPQAEPAPQEAAVGAAAEDAAIVDTEAPPPPPPAPPPATRGVKALGYLSSSPVRVDEMAAVDPHAVASTGPGLPDWQWRSVGLRWNGPVAADQTVTLLLVSPAGGFLLMLLRVGLLVALLLRLLGVRRDDDGSWRPTLRPRATPAAAAGAVLAAVLLAAAPLRAEPPPASLAPSPELLDALRERLLERAPCEPSCAEIPRLALSVAPGGLHGVLEVGAEIATAVPLPGGREPWTPATVLVDGKPVESSGGAARSDDGRLWVLVPAGRHQVEFFGPLPDRDSVLLPLPLRPHRVDATVDGWTLTGVGDDGVPDETLVLTRVRTAAEGPGDGGASELPPFVEVERTLLLGLDWRVATRVVRRGPDSGAAVLEVPLLAGESVVSDDVRVRDGKALVSLAPGVDELAWSSTLPVTPSIVLAAPKTLAWTETWQLDAATLWHVEASGIPPIHPADESARRLPVWRPWPGETVTLAIGRPEGVPGASLTIDDSSLVVAPGSRSTGAQLTLHLRSSRGDRHVLALPEGATLESFTVDGLAQPIRQSGREVIVPVAPGAHEVALGWQQPDGMRPLWRVPPVELRHPSVNARIAVRPGADRWILLLGGPRLGPAVLFWSELAAVLLVAFGLARTRLAPLGFLDWALLGVGLTQLPVAAAAVVAGWLLVLGVRRRRTIASPAFFDLAQLALLAWTAVALGILVWGLQQGLLGLPDMQIAGNGSSAGELLWYQDRTGAGAGGLLPQPWILSVPLLVYRGAMLAWALWLAVRLLRWLRWGVESFTTGGGWQPLAPRAVPTVVAAPVVAEPPAMPVRPADAEVPPADGLPPSTTT